MGAFDDLVPKKAGGAFDDLTPKVEQNSGILGDTVTDVKRGFQQLPGALTGLADIVNPLTYTNNRRFFDEGADWIGKQTGFQPGKWQEEAAKEYSPERQASDEAVNKAWEQGGIGNIAETYLTRPRSIAGIVGQALPATAGGGVIARGAMKGIAALSGADMLALRTAAAAGDKAALTAINRMATTAGGIGEGAITAGMSMDQVSRDVDPSRAALTSATSGVLTGAIGKYSGRLANKLGLPDLETVMAGGGTGIGGMPWYKRIPSSVVQESLLQEFPQSAQEQIMQNIAEKKPWDEGVARASIEGALAGAAMGGGVAMLPQQKPNENATNTPPTNPLLAQATQDISPQPGSTSQLDQTPTSFDVPKTLPPSGPLSSAVNVGIASGATSLEPVLRERDFVPPPSGSYGQLAEFEGLLNSERADKQSRVSDLLSWQAMQAASEAESQQARAEAAQAQQSAQERYNLLQQVADTLPDGRNLKRAFGRALKEAGYSNLDFTPEETASIDNFNQINRSAGIAANIGPDIEPSAPNELDASQFIKEKGAKPEPKRHASNLVDRIHELELIESQDGLSPQQVSEMRGLISQLDAQVSAKKKGIAVPTQTYGAQPTSTTPLLQTATNLGLPDVAQTDKTVKTETKREKEKPAPAIEQPTLPPESSANPAVAPQQAQKGPGLSTPIKSYAKKTAMSVASMMTRNGSPTEAYPHPSGDGTYALRVPGSGSEATPKETAPNSQATTDSSTPQDAVGVKPNSSATLTSSPEVETKQKEGTQAADESKTAEQKIRAAVEAGNTTIGKAKPITVLHNGRTQHFLGFIGNVPFAANQMRGLKSPISLARIKVGRMTDFMKKQLLVENYKLSGRDVLEQVGNSREATEEDIKQWNDAGLPVPDMEEANKPTAQKASPAQAQQPVKPTPAETPKAEAQSASEYVDKFSGQPIDLSPEQISAIKKFSAAAETGGGELVTFNFAGKTYLAAKPKGGADWRVAELSANGAVSKQSAENDALMGFQYDARREPFVTDAEFKKTESDLAARKESAKQAAEEDASPQWYEYTGSNSAMPRSLIKMNGEWYRVGNENRLVVFGRRNADKPARMSIDLSGGNEMKPGAKVNVVDGKFIAKQPGSIKAETPEATKAADKTKTVTEKASSKEGASKTNTGDAGVELTYNKRNRLTRALKWEDVADKEVSLRVKEVVKSKVSPKPDYQAMIDDGMQPVIAHIVKQAYDSLSSGPIVRGTPTDEQLQLYIKAMTHHMDGVMAWSSDAENVRTFIAKLAKRAGTLSAMQGGAMTDLSKLAEPSSGKSLLEAVYPGESRFRFNNDGEYGKQVSIIGGNKALGALQPSTDEAIKALKDIEKGWPSTIESWQRRGYSVKPSDGLVSVKKPDYNGDGYFVIINNRSSVELKFPTKEEAEKAASEIKPFLLLDKYGRVDSQYDSEEQAKEAAREKVKREPKNDQIKEQGISVSVAERTGPARRGEGEDISTERIKQTFGFKGVNFGNWMKGESPSMRKERQLHVNFLYDSFLDLAEILNIPPQAMSLNGLLGIAVGAQGSGKALAHFVPGVNEINVTRTAGAGALAHEWGHALDHNYARLAGLDREKDPFLTEHLHRRPRPNHDSDGKKTGTAPAYSESLRPEILEKFKAVVSAMNKRMETQQENDEREKAYVEKTKKLADRWMAAVRIDFEQNALQPGLSADLRSEAMKQLDTLFDKMRAMDFGDGYVKAGNVGIFPVVDGVRRLYKTMTGRVYSLDQAKGLHSALASMKYAVEHKDTAHQPQLVSTNYTKESFAQDKETNRRYWNTDLEKFARAFDAYVTDTIAEKGAKNTYLSGIEAIPPRGDERIATNAAISDLVSEFKTKETDSGTMLYNVSSNEKLTPSDKAIYGMAAEGKSAKDILKFIAASSRNPFYRQLARVLQKTGIAPKITVGDGKGFTFNAGNDKKYAASYDPKTDTVALFRPASSERHVLHELVHAATIKALSKNGMAAVQMRALFNHVKATGKMNGMYGMENVDEFVAEAFSNPKFQELLKQIAAPEGSARKTVWDRFISVIRGILGLKPISHDALSRALSLGLGVMHENMKLSEGKNLTAKGNVGAVETTKTPIGEAMEIEVSGFSSFEAVPQDSEIINFYGTAKVGGATYFARLALKRGEDGRFKTTLGGNNWETLTGKPVRGASNIKLEDLMDDAIGAALSWANSSKESPDNNDIRYNVTGDSGRAYDQAHRDFFKNVGRDINPESRIQKSLNYLRNDFWKKMAVGLVDQFRGLKDLGDNGTAYMLARLSKGTAGAFDTILHHGKLMLRDGVYDGDTSGGFVERLGVPLHGELDDVLWWIAANRAKNLAPLGKENLFSQDDIDAGKSLANGTTTFDYTIQTGPARGTVTRNRSMIYADAHRVFNEFQKNTLDMAEQSGLIDGNSRKTWESEFYVPFYRVSEEDGEFVGAKISGSLVRKRAFQKLKGGTDKLNSDLLSNTLQNWAHLITASAQNRAARASLAAAENIGVAQRVAPDMASYAASNGTMLPPGTKKTVWFQENGKKVEYLVTDPFVMTAITSLEYAGMRNGIMDAMTKFKHALTIGVTASPAFKVRNLIRDSLQAIGTSDLGYNPIKNVTEGYKQTRRDSQEYVSALASGGLIRFGTMLEGSESSRVRQLIKAGVKDSTILNSDNKWQAFYDKVIDPAVSAYNELGNRSEEINRAALYNQLIKQGKSHAEAALLARDLMDFSMQGSFNTIRFLSQVVPFFNARLQGMYKLGRAAKDDPKKMAVVTGALALASIALMAGYEDDDDWKRREDWDRDNYWWFKLGGVEYRIPKPFELGAVATLAERSVEYLTNDEMTGQRFRNVIGKIAENNLSMNPVPQMVKPIIDLYANKDSFTGRPIETMGMQRLDSDMRFNSNTSMPARALSAATLGALSPVQYDHLVRAYFGWIGATAVSSADMAARVFMNEPTKPAMDYWKVATQGMMKEQGSGSSRYLTLLYDQASELEQAYGTYRQLLKDGKLEDAKDYYESNADKLKRYKFVNSVKSMETKLNASIRSIERSDLSAEEKKTRIERVKAMKEQVAKRVAPGLQ